MQAETMRISFCCTDTKAQPWLDGLQAALPGAQVSQWQPGADPADYAVVWAPPQQFFDEQTQLKGVFNIGAGVDALTTMKIPADVPFFRLEDAGMAAQMAEYVCHAVIRHFREFDAYEADEAASKWSYRKPLSRRDFPIGVMGLGVLGKRVAEALANFDFPVLGWSRSAKSLDGVQCFAGQAEFNDFLAATRVLVCMLPLTPETENIIRRDTLARLQPRAYVINVARGHHVVDEDLIALIDSGHVAGAALDVFREEPLPAAHAFWKHPKIRVTPHMSARTYRGEGLRQIVDKIKALSSGTPIVSISGNVDLKKGY
jgi:glyoxylate/hydroxypyruvate reductase